MAQTVKRLPTMLETRVQSLGWEDLLEKEMATHSSVLAWKIPWTEEPTVHGVTRVRHNLETKQRKTSAVNLGKLLNFSNLMLHHR